MRRYWVEEEKVSEELIVLDGDVFHHVCVVCRQGLGDRFELIANENAYFGEITHLGKKNSTFKIIEVRQIEPIKKPHIHLALSLPKFQTLENVLEKSVELGVHSVHLFSSDFSFMKPKAHELLKKTARWHKIIQGATQQTGRGDLMKLTEILPLSVLLESHFPSLTRMGLLAFEGKGTVVLKDHLQNKPETIEEIWLFVGSEGGFSAEDVKLFNNYKLLPLSLGEQVLRVETACVTLLSILKYDLGHFE